MLTRGIWTKELGGEEDQPGIHQWEENPERLEGLYPEHDQDSRSLGVAHAPSRCILCLSLPLFVDLTKPVDVSTLTGNVLFPGL